MNRIVALIVVLSTIFTFAAGEEYRLGIFLSGQKIGTSTNQTRMESFKGQSTTRSDTLTVFDSKMLGDALNIRIEATSWFDSLGKPMRMLVKTHSSGRTQLMDATFHANEIKIELDNNGNKSQKVLPIPAGAQIVEDPTFLVAKQGPGSKSSSTIYVLDPTLVQLVKTTVESKGKTQISLGGKKFDVFQFDVIDPRATTKVYLSAKGDLVKAVGPLGIEMIPESLGGGAESTQDKLDIAFASSIPVVGVVERPEKTRKLTLSVNGFDLKRFDSDEHQTINVSAKTITIHPVQLGKVKSQTITQLGALRNRWLGPGMHVPSNVDEMIDLAKQIVGGETNALAAAKKIRAWVNKEMKPNAGIGILRDAREVLETKEGVCRDYAILTATLMRAAGIPARLCSGLLLHKGAFYYHAWVEAWTGSTWVAFDSTLGHDQVGADHLKLTSGSVEDALTFPILDGAKLRVLGAGY